MKPQAELTWSKYLRLFSEQNHDRPTRLGIFKGEPPAIEDLWIEDGLPLAGVDVDLDGEAGPEIEILLDNGPASKAHMTHRIAAVRQIRITLGADGEKDGLDIESSKGERMILRFENRSICGGGK